ncbi:MAG: hypothetical protein HWE11_11850 [Gammaproteobacteria bacterium]|nr:hypothetical protein [Gammaproteobacteria bacterium]
MFNLKSVLLTAVTSAAMLAATTVNAKDFSAINKDMRIMKKIIETSIAGGNRYSNRVEAMYLANQGMVFKLSATSIIPLPEFDGDWEAWGESVGASTLSVVQEAIPAIAPVLPPEARMEMEAELEASIAELDGSYADVNEETREELRRLREEARSRRDEYRDHLRELREIERERYRAEKERRKELEKQKLEVEKHIAEYKEKMKEYEKKMEEYRSIRKKKVAERKSNIVNETLTALCDYKASLRALDNDEYVTIIFADFASSRDGDDKVFVFQKSDLLDCDSDKKGIERLISKATVYQQ